MNNAALGRLIDRGNERTHVFRIGLGGGARPFVHAAQTRDHTAIAQRSLRGLAGALGGGLCICHCFKKTSGEEARGDARDCQDAEPVAKLAAKIDIYACGLFCATTALLCGGFGCGLREDRADAVQLSS